MDNIYILDTTVILHEAASVFNFPDSLIIIPIDVIEQVDRFKRDINELGKNARQFNRSIDALRSKGSLTNGIPLDNGALVQIVLKEATLPVSLSDSTLRADSSILAFALSLRQQHPEKRVTIVSKDLNLRIKADALGLHAEGYEKDRFDEALSYEGVHSLLVNEAQIAEFHKYGTLTYEGKDHILRSNEFATLQSASDGKVLGLARVAPHTRNTLVPLKFANEEMVGLKPLNIEQTFVMEALLDDSIKLVTLLGPAGTGKTLLAVAAGLRKVLKDYLYNRVLVARPTIPMGKDIGYLPGDIKEKMRPWMQPIFDAIELIQSLDRRSRRPTLPTNLLEIDELQVEPLTYIRGRSIPGQFLIIDEAQNLTPLEAKTIITRVGRNSKIILTGDCQQIDHPYMDAYSNGLSYVSGRFRGHSLAAHIRLKKGERSELAEAAVDLL